MTIQFLDFQLRASAQVADRFAEFMADRPMRGTMANPQALPFYQALSAITASGKTVILADAVSRIEASMPVKPVVLWLSKGKVVVAQTYANLQDGGKYRHLIRDLSVRLLSEYDPTDVADATRGMVHLATVGTFNQKDKEAGERLIFQSDLDHTEQSTWEALKLREDAAGIRRPLILVYDEGHNLSDQQMDLLLELEPDALLVASATMRLPQALARLLGYLRDAGWDDDKLLTEVPAAEVAGSGLIKGDIALAGYAAPMEKAIDDLLAELKRAENSATTLGLPIAPKAIYVSKTNIVEGNSFKRDDPKRPFAQREAPPILIWRYLVEEKKLDPSEVAVYATLDFHKSYPPPPEFVLFKGGDKDYENFMAGHFRHVIFNQSLQEGWDDPEAYYAYIDKSMGSNVQVEQIIGRLLRQPGAKHYTDDALNRAHIFVRVDNRSVFKAVYEDVRARLSDEAPSVTITAYEAGKKSQPMSYPPKEAKEVPKVYIDSTDALQPIQDLIDAMMDYRGDTGPNTKGEGSRALVQQRIGGAADARWKWVPYERSNRVSARWLFQLTLMRKYPRALEVTPSDDAKFDAMIELGSKAHRYLEELAEKVVETYLERVVLRQTPHNPYKVGAVNGDPANLATFKNALHDGYSGLNTLERPCAEALDALGVTWARNPSRSGYPLPLLSMGSSKTFYADFIVWKGRHVYVLDTTGEHLLLEKTGRKLLNVAPKSGAQKLHVRLIAKGRWDENVHQMDKDGMTTWSLRNDGTLRAIHCADMTAAVKESLKP